MLARTITLIFAITFLAGAVLYAQQPSASANAFAIEHVTVTGLTPLEALRTATSNPAVLLKMTDQLGSVERGKLADLLLLDADPLLDIANTKRISAVVLNGRLIDAVQRKKLLDDEQAARQNEKRPRN